ncbi:MAG TPA: hypothetical protein PLZ36_02205, partial [Armatimonadota bacterium]|nr:hypothetical protein [Armatimonadota bacterium]
MARFVRRVSPMLRIVVFALAALLLFSLHTPVSADGEIGDLVWKAAAAYNSPTGSEYPVIAFSADGTKLAVPMGFNQVGIFTAATGELQQKLAGHTDIVRQVAFSGDGKWLATGGEDMTIRIWKADAGFAHHRLLTTHTDKITGLSFSSDSTKLLSSGKDGKMLIWDTTPWTATQLADPSPTARDGSAISPNGLWAAARYARTVKVWSVQSGTVLRTYTIDAAGLSAFALAWAPNSTTLAVSAYRFVNLYNVLGADTPTAVAAETMGYSLAFSPDNKFLAVGLNAAQTRLYDPGNGYAQYTRSIVGGTGIAFSPDSTRMTAASSGVFRVYDPTSAASQVIAGPIFGESCMVRAVVPSADGQSVFLAGSANYVEERNASDGTSLRTMLIGAITQVSSLALSPDGAWLAVGASTGAVVILNAQTGAVAKTLNTGSSVVMSLAFDPTSTKLLTGSQDKLVKIWNFLPATPTHTVLGPPSTHDGHVTGVAYTSDGGKIVTIGSDSVIKVWTAAGENIWTSENLGSSLTALALSPDGALIAVGNNAGATKLFSTTTGADVRAMAGTFAGTVNDLAFTPDGAYLIGVGLTDAIVLWDAATGAVAGSATKACTTPLSVTLARGSATMVVGGDDGIGAWTLTLGAPRPDLSARSAADAGYTGVGIVNATGASQIVTAQASADMPATYDVRVANPYYQNDAYTLQGPGGGDGWTVAYYDALHADITAEIIAGTWSTGVLAPGLTAAIRAMVTPDNTVVGLTKSLTITATSQLDPLAVDVVKLNTISPIGPGASVRVSIHTDGSEGNADSQYPAMNADGTRVAFQSDAATLVDDDTNGARDIFLRRRDTGATARVSLGAGGAEANGDSWAPAINGDGTVVAFVSDATNLVAGDTNAVADIFVHDTATGITERVSLGMADEDANAASAGPALSADGTLVVFISEADNLVPGDTNECADVFLYNRTTGVTTRLSVNALGEQANAACRDAEISADGTTVAFSSLASNLATGDTNDTYDIFVVTLDTGAMVCASRSWEGAFGDDGSFLPKLSADGRYVAFTTRATNLLLALGGNGGDTNGKQDVYLCDLEGLFGPSLTLVSATALEQGNGDSGQFGLDVARDDEGTVYVVFESSARNLLGEGNDTNNKGDIFLWSQAGGLSRQSVSTLGEQANEVSRHPVISGDASIIAFDSRASNLVADDANEAYDAFVHVRGKAWQPDLLISSSADPTTFTGLNLFTLNAEQTLDVPVNTAVEKKFYVKLYNQVTNPVGSFALKVPAVDAATGWTLKYEDGGVNVTAAITGAGYPVVDMPPGAEKIIVVTARTYASSPEAAALTVQITATSVDDVSRRDVVQAIVRLTPYQTILASVNSSGGGMGGDDVGFSANGRYVCFVSGSSIQRHDRITGLTTRVDVSAQGATPNSGSADQDVSADGHLVIFKSAATNLVNPALPDGTKQQIQLKDMESGAVTIVSRASGVDGDIANDLCGEAVISPNGKYVAFASRATNLVPGVTDGKQHVYRRELEHPYTTRLVSVNNAGTPSNGDASSCGISSDGNFITWRSNASNLADLNGDGQYDATDDGNSVQDVFLHDVAAGTTELISVKHDGTASGDKQSSRDYRSPVSDDGRYVAFSSLATDLIDGQPAIGGKRQIFLRDRQAGLTSLISLDAAGDPAAADCERPTISLNGRYIGFATGAALLPFDDNALDDVYIVDRDTPGAAGLDLVSVPYNYNGATHTPLSNMKAQDPFISGDGRYIAFEGVQTDPTNLVPTNPGYTGTGGQQIYVRDRWQLAPDLMVKLQGGADWTGENTIDANVTPAQTLTPLQTEPGATATFALRLVNTGTTTDDIAITGTGGGQGWTVRYLDANDADVTAAVTGDGLLTLNMATNDVVTLTCVVTSDPFTLTGSQLDVVVTATSQRNTATRDRVKASARIAGAHKADLQIRSTADEAFLGDNVYDDGTEQTKTLAVQGGRTATYVVRIENDGGSGDDSYKLWAGQPGAGWTARFYAPDGTDITEGITNPLIGWTTDALAMGDFADIRITVTPSPSLGGGAFAPITISAQSWNDGAAADAVIARTQVAVLRQPDLIITAPAAQPVGDGVYDDGAAQTVTAVVQRGTTISYAVTLQNDGNVVE